MNKAEEFFNAVSGEDTLMVHRNHAIELMTNFLKQELEKQLRIGSVSDAFILTKKDAEIFFNEIMNPKEANEALKKAVLKYNER